jgi:hypothetical protein
MTQLRNADMARTGPHSKEASFNLRIDPALKAAFTAAALAQDKPAAQLVRDLMRAYVKQRERRVFEAKARRQSDLLAEAGAEPESDDYIIISEIEAELEDEGFWIE